MTSDPSKAPTPRCGTCGLPVQTGSQHVEWRDERSTFYCATARCCPTCRLAASQRVALVGVAL